MPDPISGLVVAGSQLVGGMMQADAASSASGQQAAASTAGIAEQRRQFDALQNLLKPYVSAGGPALQAQQAMLGLSGPEAEAAQIASAQMSPTFQALLSQGENSLLQNASATGGLRGGNTQAALAQFRPQLLAQMLEDRYSKFGGLTSLGQNSAAGVGAAGMQSGSNIAQLMAERGAAQAGGTLGQAKAFGGLLNLPSQVLGAQFGAGGKLGMGFSNVFSDIRLKKNIKKIGHRSDGLGIYSYEYIWGGGQQIGVMAQEVINVYPEAISSVGGFFVVDYSKI